MLRAHCNFTIAHHVLFLLNLIQYTKIRNSPVDRKIIGLEVIRACFEGCSLEKTGLRLKCSSVTCPLCELISQAYLFSI